MRTNDAAWLPRRVPDHPTVPTDSTITRRDWLRADISDLSHDHVLFHDPDFDEVTDRDARFVSCTFRGASFLAAELQSCALEKDGLRPVGR